MGEPTAYGTDSYRPGSLIGTGGTGTLTYYKQVGTAGECYLRYLHAKPGSQTHCTWGDQHHAHWRQMDKQNCLISSLQNQTVALSPSVLPTRGISTTHTSRSHRISPRPRNSLALSIYHTATPKILT